MSKARRFLRIQLYVFAAYRNFVRRRVNRYKELQPVLGFLRRAATFEDLLTWRQHWKERSIHPMARATEIGAEVAKRRAAAAA